MSEDGYAIGQKVRLLPIPGYTGVDGHHAGEICHVTGDPWMVPEDWRDYPDQFRAFDGVDGYIFQDTDLEPPEPFKSEGFEVSWPVAFMEPIGDEDERTKESEKDKDIENV